MALQAKPKLEEHLRDALRAKHDCRHTLRLQLDSGRTKLRRLKGEVSAGLMKPCGATLVPMG